MPSIIKTDKIENLSGETIVSYSQSTGPILGSAAGDGKNKTVPYEQVTKGVTYKGRDEILKDYPSLQDNKVSNLNKFLIDKSKQSIDLSLGVIS